MAIQENQKRKEGAGHHPGVQRSKNRLVKLSGISDPLYVRRLSAHGGRVVIEDRRADKEVTQSLQINRPPPFFMQLADVVIYTKLASTSDPFRQCASLWANTRI